MNEYVVNVIVGVVAVIVAGVSNYLLQKNKTKKDSDSILKGVEEQTLSIKDHINAQLKKANGIPWSFIEHMPLPCWAKDLNFKMIWINAEYEQNWNIKKSQYEGKTDFDVWPKEIADQFRYHDLLVMQNKTLLETIEEVPIDRHKVKDLERWKILKFPIYKDGELVGIGGIAQQLSTYNKCNDCPTHNLKETKK